MIARGKVEKLEGQEGDLIYVRCPRRTNVAARCCKGMEHRLLRILYFERHLKIDPAILVSVTQKACLELAMQCTCPVVPLPVLPLTPISHPKD
jgi:hypothetical protein